MEEHINNFLKSSTFDNIVNLHRLPITILAFTDYKKKVKTKYPEVDVTAITFKDQEEGVEKDGESNTTDFHLDLTLNWERDSEGHTIFPPSLDFQFVVVEEEEVKDGDAEVRVTEVGNLMPPC